MFSLDTPIPRKPDQPLDPLLRRSLWIVGILLLFVPSLLWIGLDRSPFAWDQSWYGQVTMEMSEAMHGSLGGWEDTLFNALPNRSPGTMWIGEFFIPLRFPTNPASGLLVCSLVLQFCSALVLFRTLVRLFQNRRAAFVSLMLICSGTLFVGMNHNYVTEPLQGLGIASFLLFLSGALKSTVVRTAMWLCFAFLVGEWGKISAAAYLVGASLVFTGLVISRIAKRRDNFRVNGRDVPLLFLLIIVSTVFGYWLVKHYSLLMGHALLASTGPIAELYGTRAPVYSKLVLWFRQLAASFFHPAILPAIVALIGVSFLLVGREKRPWNWGDWIGLASGFQVVLTIILLSLNVNEDSRFLFCLFPYIGVLLCWVISRINSPWVDASLFLIGLAQFTLVYAVAFGITPGWAGISPYLKPIDVDGRKLAVVTQTVENTCVQDGAAKLFIMPLDLAEFNANTLGFYASLTNLSHRRRCTYANLGVGESEVDRAWNTLLNRQATGVLFLKSKLDSLSPNDPFNRVSNSIYDRLSSAPGFANKHIASEPDLILFERESPDKWRFLSALFRQDASVTTGLDGRTNWKVHPGRRVGADTTILEYSHPIVGNAEFKGTIKQADNRCVGVELSVESEGRAVSQNVLDLTSPMAGKAFSIPIHNIGSENISVRIQSVDARDNIDYCWLLVEGVEILPMATRKLK